MGYFRAGFTEIVGVDIKPQPRYPFTFIQDDALDFLEGLIFDRTTTRFDAIHASPPCQAHASIGYVHGHIHEHADLIPATRNLLVRSGLPWIMENVPDSHIGAIVILCGSQFGLHAMGELDGVDRQLRRHRLFEASIGLLSPPCRHQGEPVGVYGRGGPQTAERNRGYMGSRKERRDAMGIDWMQNDELSQSIPPAYTEYIGRQLLEHLRP